MHLYTQVHRRGRPSSGPRSRHPLDTALRRAVKARFFSLFALFIPPPCAVYVCTLRRRGLMHQRVYVSGGTIQISLLFNLNIAGEKKKYERTTMSANRQIQCLSTPELFSFFRSKYNYPKVRDSRFTSRRRVNRCWHGIRKNSR